MKSVDVVRRLRDLPELEPPAELRSRILSTAAVAPKAIARTDRVWFSRACRFVGLAALVLLLVLERLAGPGQTTATAVSPSFATEARVIAETAREAGLPAEQASALARRLVSAAGRARVDARIRQLVPDALGLEGADR